MLCSMGLWEDGGSWWRSRGKLDRRREQPRFQGLTRRRRGTEGAEGPAGDTGDEGSWCSLATSGTYHSDPACMCITADFTSVSGRSQSRQVQLMVN